MEIKPNYPLSELTTFHIGGPALFYAKANTEGEVVDALEFAKARNLPVLVIGGGSNMLVSEKGFAGLVLQVAIEGRDIASETADEVLVKVGAGEIWDEVVAASVEKNFWGLENLSGIPGLTGGVPVQNVGAYGQDASQVIDSVAVLDLQTLEQKVFKNSECGFAYRTSNFNNAWKKVYAILSVTFRLSKLPKPNLSYTDVKRFFESNPSPTQQQIRDAIIEIRKNKFPDLSEFGCAGSFFKNLILTQDQFSLLENKIKDSFGEEMKAKLIEIVNKFPQKDGIKVPTAFLLDIAGLKGSQVGGARLWEKQALVIVTSQDAKSTDVVELFNHVKDVVREKTGMELTAEPEFIGF